MSDFGVHCHEHGQRLAAIACEHLREASRDCPKYVGWVQAEWDPDSTDPGNLMAWCAECQRVYDRDGGWTEVNEVLGGFRVICDLCFWRIHDLQVSLRPGAT
jgi:hypothetical protein